MDDLTIRRCTYNLIPGKCFLNPKLSILHKNAYEYWKQFWEGFYRENSIDHPMTSDDFSRQDVIGVFSHGEEIVAMHLYNFFDLSSPATQDHTYYQRSFNSEFGKKLKDRNIQTVMSFEYLTVNPNWRKNRTGLSFASLCIGLGGNLQTHLNIDAGIGISRNDVGVTQTTQVFGWEIMVPNVEMNHKPCDLMAIPKANFRRHPDEQVQKYIDHFWQNRVDYTGLTTTPATTRTAA